VLHLRVAGRNPEIVKILAERGINPKLFNIYKETVLYLAAANELLTLIKIFVKYSVELNTKDGFSVTSLYRAAENRHKTAAA
jgi:ankyrin repeat protein